MMQQINCNSCLRLLSPFSNSRRQMPKSYLSQCRHIICEHCLTKLTPYCICKRKVRFLEMSDQMPAEFRKKCIQPEFLINLMHKVNQFQMHQQQWNMECMRKRLLDIKDKIVEVDNAQIRYRCANQRLVEKSNKLKYLIQKAVKKR